MGLLFAAVVAVSTPAAVSTGTAVSSMTALTNPLPTATSSMMVLPFPPKEEKVDAKKQAEADKQNAEMFDTVDKMKDKLPPQMYQEMRKNAEAAAALMKENPDMPVTDVV